MKSYSFKTIEKDFFKGKNPLKQLLAISLDLLGAKHSGTLYGTNETQTRFLPSSSWDRGVMDLFDGSGLKGSILKLFGTQIVTMRNLSPVYFYKTGPDGRQEENDGIIAYVLRNCANYYKKGINVVICPDTDKFLAASKNTDKYCNIPFYIYNGSRISKPKNHIRVDTRIVRHFRSKNSIYIILPDYGIMVINTADKELLELKNERFVRETDLRERLDILIRLVETSSLAYLGRIKGQGAELLWRKEEHLRKAYADLSENEKKFRALYEKAPIAYFSLDAYGTIYQCNCQAEYLSGYDRNQLIGRSALHLFKDQVETEQSFRNIWETLKTGCPVKDLELHLVQKKGTLIWVSLSIDAVRDKEGNIHEMRAMAMDISKRKALEKQLFHAQKMEAIGTLARGIAHDFNNVLSPVSGYAQMMLMEGERDEKEIERIKVILECSRHAKDLVNQILTFSRQKEHQFMLLKAADAVEESMVLVRSFLPASIKIETRINKDCGYIMADPIQLHQVIMNLITNAYHAMETGGELEVKLERQLVEIDDSNTPGVDSGWYVCLKISDTGTGIAPEVLPKIFEPYYTTKEDGKGTGIGLSVVHGIVKGHGGDILVESEPDLGTSFKVYFPVCSKPAQAVYNEPKESTVTKGNESVLLVDDDTKVAFLHTQILERLGYRVACFSSSIEAFDAYQKSPKEYDLVITDYTMPDMDGIELAGKICAINAGQPVLLCTGLGQYMEAEKSAPACVAGILSKPIEIDQLSMLIRQVL
ncbi:MAG: ATP-binding protein [Desulfobacterales bacterium]|nr:ATP-binding protein [Desulfobacterales bacterium]